MIKIIEATRFLVVTTFVFLSTAGYGKDKPILLESSGEKFQYSETREFPTGVDLSTQFREGKTCQDGGTCHVHTGVNLIEAACYRATGKKVDLSEAYYYYLHFRQELEAGYPVNKPTGELAATHQDGGFVKGTFDHFSRNRVCTENEVACNTAGFFRWTKDNGNFYMESLLDKQERDAEAARDKAPFGIKTVSASVAGKISAKRSLKIFPTMFRDDMDEKVKGDLKVASKYDPKVGHIAQTEDKAVKECQAVGLQYKEIKYTEEAMLSLMEKGYPVGCAGFVQYEGDKEIDKSGRHVFAMTGYTYLAKKKQVGFLDRDSNDVPLLGAKCEKLVVIHTNNEHPFEELRGLRKFFPVNPKVAK